jgi:hypothetical protein
VVIVVLWFKFIGQPVVNAKTVQDSPQPQRTITYHIQVLFNFDHTDYDWTTTASLRLKHGKRKNRYLVVKQARVVTAFR